MKKLVPYVLVSLTILAFNSCDKVKFPKQVGSTGSSGNPNAVVRKVLLEDYTGASCGTCPPAGEEADLLETQYGNKLVRLTVHAGFLSVPSSPPMDYDFRNTVATDYYNTFGIITNPTGMVDRVGFPTTTHLLSYATWGSNISTRLANAPDVDIKISNTYNTTNRQLDVVVTSKFLTQQTGYYKLAVLFVEDSVQKPQIDYRITSPSIDNNYMHRWVLRAGINGGGTGWGDTLIYSAPVNAGDSIILSSPTFTIPTNYNTGSNIWVVDDRKCWVVAFIYDADPTSPTHYQVMQADKKRVR